MRNSGVVHRTPAVGYHPLVFTGIHIDRSNSSVRGFEQRQSLWAGQPASGTLGVRQVCHFRVTRQQIGDEGGGDGRYIEHTGLRVESCSLYICPALRSRQLYRSLSPVFGRNRRRGKQRPGDVVTRNLQRLCAKLRCEVDQIFFGRALQVERRRLGGKRLGCRSDLSGYVGLGYWVLLNIPDRFSGFTVEDKDESLFRQLSDCLDLPSFDVNVHQNRGCRRIIVPQTVMHGLVVPDAFPRFGIYGNEALAE